MNTLLLFCSVLTSLLLGYTLGTLCCRLRISKNKEYFIMENWMNKPVRQCFTNYEIKRASIRAVKQKDLF